MRIFHFALLEALQASPYGLRICDLRLAAPTQADDIVLLSLSRRGLNEQLTLCYKYANTWRYLYNPAKCAASVLDRKKQRRDPIVPALYGRY